MSDSIKAKYIWVDGQFIPWSEATVHWKTHTLHYGLGVFEGTRAYEQTAGGTAVFRLDDHLKRLEGSAKIVEINLPYDRDTLREVTIELIRRNGHPACYVRHIAILGAGAMGLYPRNNPVQVAVLTWPWGAYLGEEALQQGIRCKVSSLIRHHPNAALLKAKATGNYMNSIMAKREAIRGGYDEAIMLDVNGFVAEGSGENLFVVRSGRLLTAPITSVLQGVTRDTVLSLAQDEGIEVGERYFTRDEMYIADEVFLTGTAAELTPVREVDDRPIGEGRPGPISMRLQRRYFQAVHGELDQHRSWLAEVRPSSGGDEDSLGKATEALTAN